MRKRSRRGKKTSFGSLLAALIILLAVWFAEGSGMIELPLPSGDFLGQFSPSSASSQAEPDTAFSATADCLEVYFLDIGQGDSELIKIPNGNSTYNILIDTGEYEYADGLTEMLNSLGVSKIDRLICTHPHTDHMGCMARIIQRFEIGTVHMPRVTDSLAPTTAAYEALLDAILDKNLTVEQLSANAQIDCPAGVSLKVLAPQPDADWDDLNNFSAVIKLTYGQTSFMFTGDAETASEKIILESAEKFGQSLTATVLKCGHHGSKTSSSAAFLKAVSPQYAVISCGKDNSYGHPHSVTLQKLEKLNVQIYRTDENGTVLAQSDGTTVNFTANLPSVKSK